MNWWRLCQGQSCKLMVNSCLSFSINSYLLKYYFFPFRLECWPNIYSIYLKDGGQFGPIEFINTCVPDSFLMALYICYIHHVHIKSLFNSFEKLRAPMVFFRARMYNEAKASWLFWCNDTVKGSENYKYVKDAWSNPKDHLHMFDELIVSNNNLR